MSRIENTGKNAIWGIVTNIVYTLLGFISRYVFLLVLDETYLGISSLFTSVIGVLSFADLGLNSAFTFCFYKPIEEKDTQHIQAVLEAFRRVLLIIAGVILIGGLALIPFLRYFVKGGEEISDGMLVVYYLITLANTVISYLLTYKTCYITAVQQEYKLTPFKMAANLGTVLAQLTVLLILRSYTAWALCTPFITIVQYIVMNAYIKKAFPETNYKKAPKLPEEDKKSLISNAKAAILSKIGEICVNQTDNIIISSMIGIATTGLMSNYVLIKNAVLSVVTIIQNAVVPGLGSLIASEDEKVQKNVLYTYMFLNYCMVGFAMCGIGILSGPFIELVFGTEKVVDDITVTLMCIGFYFAYQTYALNAFPTAAGKMIVVSWASIVEGLSNLVISVAAVHSMGLPGVYFGTVASQFINYIIRGVATFYGIYKEAPNQYFCNTISYFFSAMLSYGMLFALRNIIIGTKVTLIRFVLLTSLTPLVFFGIAWLLWRRSKYGREALFVITQAVQVFLKK